MFYIYDVSVIDSTPVFRLLIVITLTFCRLEIELWIFLNNQV